MLKTTGDQSEKKVESNCFQKRLVLAPMKNSLEVAPSVVCVAQSPLPSVLVGSAVCLAGGIVGTQNLVLGEFVQSRGRNSCFVVDSVVVVDVVAVAVVAVAVVAVFAVAAEDCRGDIPEDAQSVVCKWPIAAALRPWEAEAIVTTDFQKKKMMKNKMRTQMMTKMMMTTQMR